MKAIDHLPSPKRTRTQLGLALSALLLGLPSVSLADATSSGAIPQSKHLAGSVYAMTNRADANTIVHYGRYSDGSLVRLDETETGGIGSGNFVLPHSEIFDEAADPLLNAHGLVFSAERRFLLTVNAGDDSVTVFRVKPTGDLHRTDIVASGGRIPVSIAIHNQLVYVAHAGDFVTGEPPSVVGFTLHANGRLSPIAGSVREFTPAFGFPTSRITDAIFNPAGDRLIVANTFGDEIDVFEVRADGLLGARNTVTAVAGGPFGMLFIGSDVLAVTDAEATSGIGASSVTTYRLDDLDLQVISAAVANGQTEACWLSLTPDGQHLYSSNAPSYILQGPAYSTLSHYTVAPDGSIELAEGAIDPRPFNTATQQNAAALESVISEDGQYLYQLWAGEGEVAAYVIEEDGSLTLIEDGAGTGLPLFSSAGLAGF